MSVLSPVEILLRFANAESYYGLHPGLTDEEIAQIGDMAESHQMEGICSWMWQNVLLNRRGNGLLLPDELSGQFRRSYLHHLLRNESTLRDITAIEAVLERAEIPRIYFKGPWLAFEAYPDPGMRPMNDIDLCIHECDFEKAVTALSELGYKCRGPIPNTPEEALKQAHFGHQLRFRARGRRMVELHFRLVNMGPPAVSESWLWDHTRILDLEHCRIVVPGPEAMLFHLLLHANQHGFRPLRLLFDIRWAMAKDLAVLDPKVLHDLIARVGSRTSSYYSLLLAAKLAGAGLPPLLYQPLIPPLWRQRIFTMLWKIRLVRELRSPVRSNRVEAPMFYLLELGSWPQKLHYLLGIALHKIAGAGNEPDG